MKISGQRTVTISQLEWFEVTALQSALECFVKEQTLEDGHLSCQGETALFLLKRLTEHREGG